MWCECRPRLAQTRSNRERRGGAIGSRCGRTPDFSFLAVCVPVALAGRQAKWVPERKNLMKHLQVVLKPYKLTEAALRKVRRRRAPQGPCVRRVRGASAFVYWCPLASALARKTRASTRGAGRCLMVRTAGSRGARKRTTNKRTRSRTRSRSRQRCRSRRRTRPRRTLLAPRTTTMMATAMARLRRAPSPCVCLPGQASSDGAGARSVRAAARVLSRVALGGGFVSYES